MFTLIIGQSASGKSAFAEDYAVKAVGRPLYYLATMLVRDEESRQRVARHREQRREKGFETIECPLHLETVSCPEESTLLLECLSNLAANEMFEPQGAGEESFSRILEGVERLRTIAKDLIVVTNEVFCDGGIYTGGMQRYLQTLGHLNCRLAERADRVVEVVCSLPIVRKGEGL